MADYQCHVLLSAPPEIVFDGWLTPSIHGHYAEALVQMEPKPEGRYELWGGSVFGQFLDIQRPREIRMSWKTVDFLPNMLPTTVQLQFQRVPRGTRLLITHQNIPEPMLEQFRYGWESYYCPKMQQFYLQYLS